MDSGSSTETHYRPLPDLFKLIRLTLLHFVRNIDDYTGFNDELDSFDETLSLIECTNVDDTEILKGFRVSVTQCQLTLDEFLRTLNDINSHNGALRELLWKSNGKPGLQKFRNQLQQHVKSFNVICTEYVQLPDFPLGGPLTEILGR